MTSFMGIRLNFYFFLDWLSSREEFIWFMTQRQWLLITHCHLFYGANIACCLHCMRPRAVGYFVTCTNKKLNCLQKVTKNFDTKLPSLRWYIYSAWPCYRIHQCGHTVPVTYRPAGLTLYEDTAPLCTAETFGLALLWLRGKYLEWKDHWTRAFRATVLSFSI